MRHALLLGLAAAVAAGVPWTQASAQMDDPVAAEFDKFREVLEKDNPAELWEVKGEQLWTTPGGPKKASLEKCDLGLGPGVVKGAYAQMPRYFADVDRVMDAEARIVHCMITLQGYELDKLDDKPFSSATHTPDPVSITTYVAAQSAGMKLAPPQNHPKEKAAYAIGKEIFHYRAGSYDFSCASCHGVDGQRIRTQPLPNFTKPEQAIRSVQGWPGYRMTGGVMHTLQWRLTDCYRQQRFPEPGYTSETLSALLTYLTVNASGQVYKGPGIKR
ncbi:MAG: sulfur oxidation c-type cytochrome SoxA [Betaproteobacteria bacterium]|nr:sulfur oxidation c-type cytochrome SoxA [Betaproteobacteria bacterium]MDH5220566.1 sulfur oxidation c-type cytochrome SoxA [Betaproteobacteria bacterium]MDH5351171.1 sulfur oxidation c-type cytochrome SoxA [Betaproteobacteria bacterium]